ncbi:hypothetical protein OG462_36130 [Streptomyces sp. NBC_01077]|uniref:hypothetical protein n=1 Tax=Streptomyces sp. NBC_01077 TaxID=2903746 RepID=UPI00386560FF|nr:hypothetical protein OG462_36130 [Streptomyces sp. NBC_01077]
MPVSRKGGNTFKAKSVHPELSGTDGFVSLRAEVWDAAGSRTVQDITKARAEGIAFVAALRRRDEPLTVRVVDPSRGRRPFIHSMGAVFVSVHR